MTPTVPLSVPLNVPLSVPLPTSASDAADMLAATALLRIEGLRFFAGSLPIDCALHAGRAYYLADSHGAGQSRLLAVCAGWCAAAAGQLHISLPQSPSTQRPQSAKLQRFQHPKPPQPLRQASQPTASSRASFDLRINVNRQDANRIGLARAGLLYISRNSSIFHALSVKDNLRLAQARFSRQTPAALDFAAQVHAAFPLLQHRANLPAGQLSGGEQKILALAIALTSPAQILLLDQPLAGLAHSAIEPLAQLLNQWLMTPLPEHANNPVPSAAQTRPIARCLLYTGIPFAAGLLHASETLACADLSLPEGGPTYAIQAL